MNWPVFFTRLGSAVVYAALMMVALLGGSVWFMFVWICLIQFLCLNEFYRLSTRIFKDAYFPKYILWIAHLAAVAVTITIALSDISVVWLSLLFPVIIFSGILAKKTALEATFSVIASILYISFPLAFFIVLWRFDFALPLALVLMIWMNDTMAYLVGSFIGKTPFSPISPKKTWEGTLGGGLLTIVGAGVWSHYTSLYSPQDWMILAGCAVIAGTAGDLLESKLKRLADIKDSGNIMPGHGGALDRFDSLLVALPFAFVYVLIFMAG